MMKLFISLLLISYVYSQSFSVGSDSVSNSAEFKYRKIDKFFINAGAALGLYSSVSVEASATNTSGNISASAIYMGIHTGVPNVVEHAPFNWMASFKGKASFSLGADFLTSLSGEVTLIVTAFSHIEERKPDGSLVRRKYLKDMLFTSSTGNTGKMYYVSFKSTGFLPSEKVEIHYFVADELGEVTFEGVTTFASPKTLESFIIISDWKYADDDNYLVLVSGVASGSLSAKSEGSLSRSSLSSGEGEGRVYAYFANEARIDGSTKEVSVKTTTAASLSAAVDNSLIQGKLNTFYKGGVSAQIVESSFAKQPGAKKIVYDPTLGAGNSMQNGVSKVVFFAVAYLIALLIQ